MAQDICSNFESSVSLVFVGLTNEVTMLSDIYCIRNSENKSGGPLKHFSKECK